MPIANLYNVPNSEQDLLEFSFYNQDEHRLLIDAIAKQKNVTLTLYLLDPISMNDPKTFLQIHQQAHNDFTGVLGIQGVDLTDVDFRDPEQMASWSRLHAFEHQQAAQILGII